MNVKKTIIAGVIFIIIITAFFTVLGINAPKYNTGSDVAEPGGGIGAPSPMDAQSMPSRQSKELAITDSTGVSGDTVDKKIIKNGYLTMKVNNADSAAENIGNIAKNNGGGVFSSNFSKNPQTNIKSGTITIRVPVANFDKALTEIKKAAALVVQESTTGQDVTEEYTDLQAQLKNKRAEEQQFVAILGRAQKIQDILDVTEQLSRVRGEIEQLQGRIKYLNSQADMSSITATLSEDQNITISDTWRPLQVMKDAVNSLLSKIRGFVNFVIVLIITVIPVIILYALLALVIYWIGKKIYKKFKKEQQQKNR